jgi:hypothetical protein
MEKRYDGYFGSSVVIDGDSIVIRSFPMQKDVCTIDDIRSVNLWEAGYAADGQMVILTANAKHDIRFTPGQNDAFVELYKALLVKIDPYLSRTYTAQRNV